MSQPQMKATRPCHSLRLWPRGHLRLPGTNDAGAYLVVQRRSLFLLFCHYNASISLGPLCWHSLCAPPQGRLTDSDVLKLLDGRVPLCEKNRKSTSKRKEIMQFHLEIGFQMSAVVARQLVNRLVSLHRINISKSMPKHQGLRQESNKSSICILLS